MKKISILIIMAAVFTSCAKDYLDVNTTPNNPTVVPPSTILPNTTIAMAFANGNDLNRAASVLVQHTAGVANQVANYDLFALDGAFDNQWNSEIYNGAINNLQILIDQHSATSPAYSGIAKIEMAYVFSLAADLWGDIPYSQAGQGLKFESPRFDKLEDIYKGNTTLGITSLFDLVKSGIADLNKTANLLRPGADDRIYNGDLARWRRAANTLLMKLALQVSNKEPALTKSTIEAVLASPDGYINSNALDFEVPFGSAVGNRNPIFDFNNVNRTGDMMLSRRLLDLMRPLPVVPPAPPIPPHRILNDSVRLARFFTKPNNVFVGFVNGTTAAAPLLATRSKYNTYLLGAVGGEAPIRLLTNFQAQFILAEAVLRFNVTSTISVDSFYRSGIRASMAKVGMDATEIARYFADNPAVVNLSGTNEQKLEQIITQKYIAWIGNGIEAYNDYRRTGYPSLVLPLNTIGDNPNVIPTRLPYPPAELARNPNAPKPRPRTDVKLWWAL